MQAGPGVGFVPALRDDAPCRLLGELLDLDAVWIVAPGPTGREVTARWEREAARQHRFGEARLAAVVQDIDGEAVQTRDGRYAVLVAPLVVGGRAVAHLVGSTRAARAFRPDELRAAELVAAGAAARAGPVETPTDVVSTRARDRLLAQMGLLRSLTSRLAYARSEGEIAHAVVAELVRQDRFHTPRFYLRSEAGDELALLAQDGEDRDADDLARVGDTAAAGAVVDGRARLIPGEAVMVAPMLGDEDAMGAIVVSGPRGDAFDALDLGVLEVVAAHTAVACRNVRLYASMREAAEIAEAMLELGAALAAQVSVGAGTSPASVSRTRSAMSPRGHEAAPGQHDSAAPRRRHRRESPARPNSNAASADVLAPSASTWEICNTATVPAADVVGTPSTGVKTCNRHALTRGSSWSSASLLTAARQAAQLLSSSSWTVNWSASTSPLIHAGYVIGVPSRNPQLQFRASVGTAANDLDCSIRFPGMPANPYRRNWSLGILADIQYVCASTAASRRTVMLSPSDAPDEVDDMRARPHPAAPTAGSGPAPSTTKASPPGGSIRSTQEM